MSKVERDDTRKISCRWTDLFAGRTTIFECRTITSLIFRNFILSYDAERPMKAGMNVKSGARDHVVVKWTGLDF